MGPLEGVFNEAWGLYKAHWRHFFVLAIVVYAALLALNVLLVLTLGRFGAFVSAFVYLAGAFWLQGAIVKAVEDVRDGRADLSVPAAKFNRAMRIDTTLVNPLRRLPGFPAAEANLAFRNLTRARMVRLATGQQMATFLKSKGVTLTKLTKAQIRVGNKGAKLDRLTQPQRAALLRNTPLWFYILREAEFNAGRLKGVGARIVAETFHRAMEGSAVSIVRDPSFKPSLGPNNQTFRMVDLLLFAFEGKKNLLAPVGD